MGESVKVNGAAMTFLSFWSTLADIMDDDKVFASVAM